MQQFGTLRILFAVFAHQPEILLQCLSFSLTDTTRQVQIYEAVGIDVVQACTVGVVYANGGLPCLSPCRNIFLCQAVGLLHELCGKFKSLPAFGKAHEPVHFRIGIAAAGESLL